MSTLLPALAINRPKRPWSTFLLEFVDIDNRYYLLFLLLLLLLVVVVVVVVGGRHFERASVPAWDSQLLRSYAVIGVFLLYSFLSPPEEGGEKSEDQEGIFNGR